MDKKSFLKEYSLTPIVSSFSLAKEVIKSNYKLIFIMIALYSIIGSLLYFLGKLVPENEEMVWASFGVVVLLMLLAFMLIPLTVSNLLYYSNILKSSENLIELREKVKNIDIKLFYTQYFFSAFGYVVALSIVALLVWVVSDLGSEVSQLFSIPLLVVALLFIYTLPVLLERISRERTFKAGFKSLFLLFNFSFLKKLFTLEYFLFIFVFNWISSILSKLSDLPAKILSSNKESLAFMFTDYLFTVLFTIFVTIILVAISTVMAREILENRDKD